MRICRTCAVGEMTLLFPLGGWAGSGHSLPSSRCSEAKKGSNLFDHLVGAGEQRQRHSEAERFRSSEVDDQLDFCRLLNR
jgi:hypothetical protein